MDVVLIALVAALASALTLYSGFGLGTVLLPAFALFLPVPVAVAATGIVHLLNNLFKGALLWRRADWRTVLRLGIPAIPAAILGAWLLAILGDTPRLFEWASFGRSFGPTAADLTVGLLMIAFAALELQRWFQKLEAPPGFIPLGGLLSGFFGGLTGQQGAFRSVFLLRAGLTADRFIATGVMIAVIVDLTRLTTYAATFDGGFDPAKREGLMILVGTLSAFLGAFIAARYLDKMTIGAVRYGVAGLMFVIGAALSAGVID
ncbi:sulfite exporter TauE/SafE family protein [Sphingomonas sp. HDW15A]|uniref:sulfite exporter TauE/SafE family protein n=1 Tax=Sphingomonas sp. HDW15A TaxID=2714942 RepID=UPI00140D3611|nr:sulfite exporter TauE/SafE family protein [Sphingomonas sp. HDW15A]QIK95437.1 sulfite exporter TauE/SafE family protein [Sphingomonas sp. HDW15A]